MRVYLENDEIVHFRPSGNAQELRCYAEADTSERASELVDGCLLRLAARRDGRKMPAFAG